jgi:glycosyltransferase involved in cell wall biosynthesis
MSISSSLSDRERFSVRKVVRLAGQVVRSARLAASGFDAYYPISQNRMGLLRDLALLAPFRIARRRIVVHLHGGLLDRFLACEPAWLRRTIRWALSGPEAGGIVLTPSLRHCLEPLVPQERISVVPNTALAPAWVARKDREDNLRVLFMSTLIETKGYRELAAAVAALAARGAKVELDIAGEPYAPGDVEWMGGFGSHPAVRFRGRLDGDDKWEAFRRADVFALPTTYPPEGQPISIIEAMAAACAILATEREGIADMVGPDQGVLIPARVGPVLQSDLERVILELAANRDRTARLGQAARARYEAELSPELFIGFWLEALTGR